MRNLLKVIWLMCFWTVCAPAIAGTPEADNAADGKPDTFIVGLPETAVHLESVMLPDGSRHDEYLLPNWPATIGVRRLPPIPSHIETLEQMVIDEWPEANALTFADFPPPSAAGYPAVKAEFETGANEDTMRHSGVFLFTDSWTFWIDIAASVDVCIDGVDDARETEEYMRQEVDKILREVRVTDTAIESITTESPRKEPRSEN